MEEGEVEVDSILEIGRIRPATTVRCDRVRRVNPPGWQLERNGHDGLVSGGRVG
jgi:hypothetical protein